MIAPWREGKTLNGNPLISKTERFSTKRHSNKWLGTKLRSILVKLMFELTTSIIFNCMANNKNFLQMQ